MHFFVLASNLGCVCISVYSDCYFLWGTSLVLMGKDQSIASDYVILAGIICAFYHYFVQREYF
jgi:hypothetical protein